jgi:ABC-type branched-subunit amino acid transport system permease subunit
MTATVSQAHRRIAGPLLARWNALPFLARFGLFVAALAFIPFLVDNDYVLRVLGTVSMFAALAIALNVVVGYAGLLDLGFVAFYGLGAYGYGLMSSPQLGLHWPAWLSLPAIALLGVLFGLLLGSPSLRLSGDYLAIVTLGFGLIFVQLSNTLDRVEIPGRAQPLNLTGGANGLIQIDGLNLFGFELTSVTHYYYAFLIWLVIVMAVVYFLNQSRIGRAWRAMGEDPLAAEVMGMPTRRLKLLAFATGAGIAGVTGAIFAAWQGNAFPQNFGADVLINLYAMMVLGGIGNLAGAVLGASVLSIVPELLRSPELIRIIFYLGLVLALLLWMRPRRNGLIVLAGLIGFGLVVKSIAQALVPDLLSPPTLQVASESISSGFERFSQQFGIYAQQWILLPKDPALPGNLAFVILIPTLMGLLRMKAGPLKLAAMVPALYLLAFVWETRLTAEPAVTRLLLIGSLLVIMMIFRPHGLLGKRKVEIV